MKGRKPYRTWRVCVDAGGDSGRGRGTLKGDDGRAVPFSREYKDKSWFGYRSLEC